MSSSKYWKRLSGDLWPVHVKPNHDELFSSWFMRFSMSHMLPVETMASMLIGPRKPIWTRDIDKSISSHLLNAMSVATGTTIERTIDTTLAAYEGRLSEKINVGGCSRWIIPLRVFHRDRLSPGLMFCPLCFQEESSAYYKRTWRLAWSITCTKHGCYLLDACPACNSPVAPHKNLVRAKMATSYVPYTHCYNCGINLSLSPTTRASALEVQFQEMLEKALDVGFIKWANNSNLYSFLFFDGLRAITSALQRADRRTIKSSTGITVPTSDIEHMPIDRRRSIMKEVGHSLTNWPDSLYKLAQSNDVKFHQLKTFRSGMLPYWYEAGIQPLMNLMLPVSPEELQSMQRFAIKHYGNSSLAILRKVSKRRLKNASTLLQS